MRKIKFYILILILALSFLVPVFSPYSANEPNIDLALSGPSLNHFFGTDSLGRDLFTRVFLGAQTSLFVGILTSITALIIGTIYGGIAGIRGGLWDTILMRVLDILSSIPNLILVILISFILKKIFHGQFGEDLIILIIAMGATNWFSTARSSRNLVWQTKNLPYIESAKAIGATDARIAFRHVLPNILSSMLILFNYHIPSNILNEGVLSFLGLGIHPPNVSWGTLILEGWKTFTAYPHLIGFPCLVLFLVMWAFNGLSDDVAQKIDPHHRAADRF